MTEALRDNEGKPDHTYIEEEIRDGIAKVMAYGATKYARDNWKNSINTSSHDQFQHDIVASLLRHAFAVASGTLIDDESGQSHMAHVACNAMMWMAYQERKDDV